MGRRRKSKNNYCLGFFLLCGTVVGVLVLSAISAYRASLDTGACCRDDVCSTTFPQSCVDREGVFFPGTSCVTDPCASIVPSPQPTPFPSAPPTPKPTGSGIMTQAPTVQPPTGPPTPVPSPQPTGFPTRFPTMPPPGEGACCAVYTGTNDKACFNNVTSSFCSALDTGNSLFEMSEFQVDTLCSNYPACTDRLMLPSCCQLGVVGAEICTEDVNQSNCNEIAATAVFRPSGSCQESICQLVATPIPPVPVPTFFPTQQPTGLPSEQAGACCNVTLNSCDVRIASSCLSASNFSFFTQAGTDCTTNVCNFPPTPGPTPSPTAQPTAQPTVLPTPNPTP
jgi:hypothetical protein